MKSHQARLMKLALVGTLVAGGVSAVGRVAHADPSALRAKAQAETDGRNT
jgi:hypothetical protein